MQVSRCRSGLHWLYSTDLICWQCHVRQGHAQLSLWLVLPWHWHANEWMKSTCFVFKLKRKKQVLALVFIEDLGFLPLVREIKIQWQTFSLSQSVAEKETQNAMINTGIQCLLIILDSYAYGLYLVCFLLCWNEIIFGNKTIKSVEKICRMNTIKIF
jgi:hypothetical protein